MTLRLLDDRGIDGIVTALFDLVLEQPFVATRLAEVSLGAHADGWTPQAGLVRRIRDMIADVHTDMHADAVAARTASLVAAAYGYVLYESFLLSSLGWPRGAVARRSETRIGCSSMTCFDGPPTEPKSGASRTRRIACGRWTSTPHSPLPASHRAACSRTIRGDGRPQLSNIMYVHRDGDVLRSRSRRRGRRRRTCVAIHGRCSTCRVRTSGTSSRSTGPRRCPRSRSDEDDETVEQLVEYYRRGSGEHPDWAEFRAIMVARGASCRHAPPHVRVRAAAN